MSRPEGQEAVRLDADEAEVCALAAPVGPAPATVIGPAPSARGARLYNLPLPLTPLIGREREVAEACRQLRERGTRLLTLTGPGGIGKTRLALAAAGALRRELSGGVALVDLAPLRDPAQVLPALAQALGVEETREERLFARVGEVLCDEGWLLVLDNFEHLIPAAPQVAALLGGCTTLRALVTSRVALGVRGERTFPVPPLPLPPSAPPDDLDALAAYPSVALFVERARASAPDFALTTGNAAAVAAICARLDGLPLAIELAAARVPLLPPASLLARLGHRLAVLTGGPDDLPDRQRTLRAAIDWSYNLLDPPARALFARLAVFVGGATLDAIEAVLPGRDAGMGGGDLLGTLATLVRASLVQRVAGPDDEPRFALLETLAEYAGERLRAGGDEDDAQLAHAAYYADLAERAAPALRGPKGAAVLARLAREQDNLRAALRWALAIGAAGERRAIDLAARLGGALWPYWWIRGYLSEGRRWLAAVAALADGPQSLTGLGVLAWFQGDYDAGREALDAALARWRAAGDECGVAFCLDQLAIIARQRGDFAAARVAWAEALPLQRALAARSPDGYTSLADMVDGLGLLLRDAGETAAACPLLEEGLALRRARGDDLGRAFSLNNLGDLARGMGDHAAARRLLEEGLALRRAIEHRPGIAISLNSLGILARDEGDLARSRALLEEALGLRREVGDGHGIASSLNQLALLALAEGRPDEAHRAALESLALRRELGQRQGIADALETLGRAAAAWGLAAEAARLWGAAEALREAVGAALPPVERAAHARLADAARERLTADNWRAAWAAGRALDLDGAAALAAALPELAVQQPVPPPLAAPAGRHPAGSPPGALSRREREVAALIARGLTNRQIARDLFIGDRTVDTHVAGILRKLGFATRAQIAAWAAEHGVAAPSDN